MGANAPIKPPLPEVMAGNTLTLEGKALEVSGLDDALPHRSFVWIPSIKAIVGGVNVFGGLHAWTADTQSAQERAAWASKLDRDGRAATGRRRARPHAARPGARRFADRLHAGLPGSASRPSWPRRRMPPR